MEGSVFVPADKELEDRGECWGGSVTMSVCSRGTGLNCVQYMAATSANGNYKQVRHNHLYKFIEKLDARFD
jgi:hypothetical protein